uniref:Uncharacterized protein n=1 Tax=Heterorhabditis bacteriophora TaxID=37862 RepID=A0A1I7WZG2_HETBA
MGWINTDIKESNKQIQSTYQNDIRMQFLICAMNFTASSPTNRETYDIPVNVCSSLQDLLDSAADKPDLQYRSTNELVTSIDCTFSISRSGDQSSDAISKLEGLS